MQLSQAKLDLTDRSRTSLLPWRGQFSPDLIEYLIENFCLSADIIADPFCGSGTVLAEAQRSGRGAIGIDVNPAAYVLSLFTSFVSANVNERRAILNDCVSSTRLFMAEKFSAHPQSQNIREVIETVHNPMAQLLLHIAALVGCGDSKEISLWKLAKGVQVIQNILEKLPVTVTKSEVLLGDAREKIATVKYDAIITSPPYINVFNYHQNYRPIMEHLGWAPLACATVEIGANRKHRQNRFLTVVQYCIDMAIFFRGCRVGLATDGPLIMVVGRESNVLRTAFYNGALMREVAQSLGLFQIRSEYERCFTNRFGAQIYEDVLIFDAHASGFTENFDLIKGAREIGIKALKDAYQRASPEAQNLIDEAILNAASVNQSAPLKPCTSPAWFQKAEA